VLEEVMMSFSEREKEMSPDLFKDSTWRQSFVGWLKTQISEHHTTPKEIPNSQGSSIISYKSALVESFKTGNKISRGSQKKIFEWLDSPKQNSPVKAWVKTGLAPDAFLEEEARDWIEQSKISLQAVLTKFGNKGESHGGSTKKQRQDLLDVLKDKVKEISADKEKGNLDFFKISADKVYFWKGTKNSKISLKTALTDAIVSSASEEASLSRSEIICAKMNILDWLENDASVRNWLADGLDPAAPRSFFHRVSNNFTFKPF
jgi:hypothetical protein